MDYPELVDIRFRLPGVALRMQAWNVSVEEVCGFGARLERLELESDLLRRMTQATAAAAAAWELWVRQRYPHA
jgi:hypothetical protein